jgi:drug/metabolite transporter superfamily protein YnfA
METKMTFWNWVMVVVILIAAAIFEVGGDAAIRKALRGYGLFFVLPGCVLLASYGVVVNFLSGPDKAPQWMKSFISNYLGGYQMDFNRLLGVYVALFALISILWGWRIVKESIPGTTWAGLILIVIGGIVIQFGQSIAVWFSR